GTLEQRGGGRVAASRLGATRRGLQFVGDELAGLVDGMSQVPSAPIGVLHRIGSPGQRFMHFGELVRVGGPVDRRASQWMTEAKVHTELYDPLGLCGTGGMVPDAKECRSTPQERQVADRLGCCQEQQPLSLAWQASGALQEAVLDADRQWQGTRKHEASCPFRYG